MSLTMAEKSASQPNGELTQAVGDDKSMLIDEIVRTVLLRAAEHRPIWATYRLQFTAAQFRFADARDLAEYFSQLGVSHLYSSPNLTTRRGSTHGYDVVDHTRLNPELGGEQEFVEFADALENQGLAQLVDIVPNHMCVASDENAWWLDVLAHGPASRYANYFDIDWHPVKRELEEKVLLPILGDFYGNVLEAGQLQVVYRDGAMFVRCHESHLPLDPKTWVTILSPGIDVLSALDESDADPDVLEFRSILTALQHLPDRNETGAERIAERNRESQVIQGRLKALTERSSIVSDFVARNVETLNGTVGDPASFNELDRLLDAQAFQLSHWKAGSDEMNYRRFFDVTELAAVCMENLDVFETTHRLLFELLTAKRISGLRIDHIDGLFDPAQYLWRLQWGYLRALGREAFRLQKEKRPGIEWAECEAAFLSALHVSVGGPHPATLFQHSKPSTSTESSSRADNRPNETAGVPLKPLPLFVLVEKILGADEPLPTDWPVSGTTGYDFTNLVNGLFISGPGLHELERQYARFIDERQEFRETVYESKRLILDGAMQSELVLLANRLDRLSHRHRRSRDYTLQSLRSALREIIACFPVYRTYIHGGQFVERDRRVVQFAVAQARRRNPTMDASVFDFIRDVLLLKMPLELSEEGLLEREFFIGRFQQVTSPVMAKGVEDTAFYRYFPLVSANEVGGEPLHAVTKVEEFHRQNAARANEWPLTMLATTTHDTKRSEDVRARINVLAEIPGQWRTAVQRWARWNRKYLREVDGEQSPSRNDQWLFYQTLVGMWPLAPINEAMRAEIVNRVQRYMEKATHEAKLETSWINPNPAYDEAVRDFVAKVLADPGSRFMKDLQSFHESIVNSGLYTALSQTLLKLTAPGIPDIYQGQEIWDFSLVDPDNRRPVDYSRRRWLLAEVASLTATPEAKLEFATRLAGNPRDERTKLLVTRAALHFRQSWPDLASTAEYVPLAATGARAEHVCAFAWRDRGTNRAAIVIVPRLIFTLSHNGSIPPIGDEVWGDTVLTADGILDGSYLNLMTGELCEFQDGKMPVKAALEHFPVALLMENSAYEGRTI